MLKRAIVLFAVSIFLLAAKAQQTQVFVDREAAFKNGLELFDEANYLSARQKFEEIYKQLPAVNTYSNQVLLQNLEYYIAACAAETNDKDAEQLLLNYIKNHHETDKRRSVYFYLGKYYYRNARYADAVTYFTQVQISDLANKQIYEYKFQLGYAYFTKKKFAEAKPLFNSVKDIKDKYYYPATYYYAFICFYTKDYTDALDNFLRIEDSKMYATVIPYYVAQIYYLKKDYDKTIAYINKALLRGEIQYKDEMRFLLGKAYFQKSEYAKAYPLLNDYISKSSKVSKEDIYQLGYCAYKNSDYSKAIENFKQLNLLDDTLGQNATYAMADCYLKLNQKDKARSAFQSAAAKAYDITIQQNSLFNYGKLSFELGYSSEAIQSFETYLEKFKSGNYTEEVNELLAAALVQTKNYERAYRIMETLQTQSVLIKQAYQKVTYFRAIELFNDGKTDEAQLLCDKSLTNPLDVELQALALYLKAEILYKKENYSEAAQNYQRFAQYATPAIDKKGEASKFRTYYNAGYCYFKLKNYTDAATYFSSAIAESAATGDARGKTSLLPDLYLRYADCSFITKSYSSAIIAYSKITDMNWTGGDYAQYQKGIILGLQGKDDEKVTALNSLLSKYPGSNYADPAGYEIGETYMQNGNFASARAAYQSIISRNPNSQLLPRCYLKIAVIDYNSGKKEMAIDDYQTVVKKYPKSNEAQEALSALKDIYVEVGRADEYFDFVKNNSNITVNSAEQDSLTYQSAELAYHASDCPRAIRLYDTYLTKFSNGFFAAEANWKKAECHIKAKEYISALTAYEAIVQNKYSKYYEKALLKSSGIAYYELKDYAKASAFYKQLYIASTSAQNTYTALVGMLRSAVNLNRTDEVIEFADQFINSGVAKDADLQEAVYVKGKAYYSKGDKDFALGVFNRVTEMPVSEKAVEAKYMVAKILYEQKNYKNSLDTCFRVKNKYSSYEYWVAKTFLLIADNYYAMGNSFQAKATLESIIENYDGDAAVLDEAKAKLAVIRTEELNKSKIMQIAPADTLIMETDSLINN